MHADRVRGRFTTPHLPDLVDLVNEVEINHISNAGTFVPGAMNEDDWRDWFTRLKEVTA